MDQKREAAMKDRVEANRRLTEDLHRACKELQQEMQWHLLEMEALRLEMKEHCKKMKEKMKEKMEKE